MDSVELVKRICAERKIPISKLDICRDLDLPDNVIVEKLQEKYKLSRKAAEDYLLKASASSVIP